jgi:lipopolysaccharide transport system ATP-binding protein
MPSIPSRPKIRAYTRFDSLHDRLLQLRSQAFGDPAVPTLMHMTHVKAGSTWINGILQCLFGGRCAPRGKLVASATGGDIARHVFAPGRVYRAMFLTREEFQAHPELRDIKRFIIIRDLRDTLVSLYFSLKISHPLDNPSVEVQRKILHGLSEEEGLAHLIDTHIASVAHLQRSWLGHGEILLRYEDIMADPLGQLRAAWIDRLELPVPPGALDRAIRRTHFENIYRRRLGEEDVASHGRRGAPGDWRNHFTPGIRRHFAGKFGEVLIATGHEPDDTWSK